MILSEELTEIERGKKLSEFLERGKRYRVTSTKGSITEARYCRMFYDDEDLTTEWDEVTIIAPEDWDFDSDGLLWDVVKIKEVSAA
jgi:hypothetical protein